MPQQTSTSVAKVPFLFQFNDFSNISFTYFDENIYNGINLSLLTSGLMLNTTLLITILFSSSMRTSLSCYLLSLICSDLILLSDVLREVLLRYCGVNFQLNLDYVSYVTFEASVLTLAMLSLDRYVFLCHFDTIWRKIIPTIATAMKSILVIWCMSIMTTAMQLHLHNRMKEETFGNIFVSATIMFVVLPTAVIIFLTSLILYENKTCLESRNGNQAETLLLLGGLTIGFFITMVPRRVALVIYFLYPSECCSVKSLNMYYLVTKLSSAVNPTVCIVASALVRNAMKDIFCRCRWSPIKLSLYEH